MLLIAHANQRGGDAQPAALRANRALHEIVDRELPADLGGRFRRALVAQRAALDAQALGIDLRERGAGLLGEAGGQVVALGIAAEVLERQHGECDP